MIVAVLLAACTRTTSHYERITAASGIDQIHRLGISVRLFDGAAPPGLTPIRIEINDDRQAKVRDAVVYVELESSTGATPKMTVVARSQDDFYRADLPLVYGSRWTFTIKAFSGGRTGLLRVTEDME